MLTALKAFLNSPVGPKTTHFWGPVANWGFVLALLLPTADTARSSSIILTLGDAVIPGIFVALALCIALPKCSKNRFFNCAFLRYTVGLTVAIVTMNWFQAAQDGTNQLMGKVWNWNNMYGTKLKKIDGWILHTTNEDGNGGEDEDDAAALPEDHEGGPEDGYGGEEDDAAPLGEDDGGQDDRGAGSEDSDDDIEPLGLHVVQLLAIRANFHVRTINGYDWRLGRCIYRQHEMEVEESCFLEGMVDLVPIGPIAVLEAYGAFALEVFYPVTIAGNTTTGNEWKDANVYPIPMIEEWDVDDHGESEPEEYTQTVYCRGPRRKLEITYLVIPNAIETNVEVKLKLKDLGSRSRAVYGKIKASTADYGNKSVHLFSCERGRSWSVPSSLTSILPLSPAVIAFPYRRQLELHIEVDLIVITIFDNQEEYKNLKFSLTFTRGIRSQEREVDDDRIEVSIAFDPEI